MRFDIWDLRLSPACWLMTDSLTGAISIEALSLKTLNWVLTKLKLKLVTNSNFKNKQTYMFRTPQGEIRANKPKIIGWQEERWEPGHSAQQLVLKI